jgi:diguanylate cyclase (GGDEF)-like protein
MLWFTSAATALNPDRLPSQYLLDRYGRDSGLPSERVWTSTQGPRGYLWVGTRGGLARFDGVKFTTFNQQTQPEFKASDVRSLEWTPSGDLWIGTYGGGALLMREGHFRAYTTDDGLSGNIVNEIHRAADGALWFATDAGVSRFDGSEFRTFTTEDGLAANRTFEIAEDLDGTLWFSTLTDGLSYFDGNAMHTLGLEEGLDSLQVHMLDRDEQLGVIAGTASGSLYQLTAGLPAKKLPLEKSRPVQTSLRDRDGNLWLGSYGGGLWRVRDNGMEERIRLEPGSETEHVFGLLEDTRGNLWVSTPDGLFSLRDSPFLALGNPEGIADSSFVVTAERDGTLWVGTEGKGLFRIDPDGGQSQPYPQLKDISISSLLVSSDGSLWVGSFGKGLFHFDGDISERYSEAEGLSGVHVFALQEMRDGSVWIATDRGVDKYAQSLPATAALPELKNILVRHMHQTQDGAIFLSSNSGLYEYREGSLKQWTVADGLASDLISTSYEDDRGVLWVANRDGGLARLFDGQLFSFGKEHGISQMSAYAILEDRSRNLWISGTEGMLRVSRDDLDAVARGEQRMVRTRLFDEQDGLRSTQFVGGYQPAAWKTPDNRLWYVTTKGLTSFSPPELNHENPSLRTYIEAVRVDGEPVTLGKTIDLPATLQTLEIDYSSPELGNPEAINFRYSNTLNEDGWQSAGGRRTAYFTALPAGESVFRVQARMGDGAFTDAGASVASIRLNRQPRWYETTWSVLAAVALIIALISLLQRLMSRRARVREQQLLRLVDQRTTELRDALVRVEANSRIDSLTGVANRRHLEEQLAAVWNMARRSAAPVSILMLDIDYFKQYNDALGHKAGDDCLRVIARAIKDKLLREHDMLARYGGEEFVVVLYDSDAEGAQSAAQRILECVRALQLPHPDSPVSGFVTISIGCATAWESQIKDPHKLIDRADKALYQAKNNGRNNAARAEPLSVNAPTKGR